VGPEQLVRSRALNFGSDPLATNELTTRDEKNGVIRREQALGRIADLEDSFNETIPSKGQMLIYASTMSRLCDNESPLRL